MAQVTKTFVYNVSDPDENDYVLITVATADTPSGYSVSCPNDDAQITKAVVDVCANQGGPATTPIGADGSSGSQVVKLNKEQFVSVFTANELVAVNMVEAQVNALAPADYAAVAAGTGTPTQQGLVEFGVAYRIYDATVDFFMNDPRIAAYLEILSALGVFGTDTTASAARIAAILATPQPA